MMKKVAGLLVLSMLVSAASADFYLEKMISVADFFGPLGNNPVCLTSDGSYAYVGGYTYESAGMNLGILKINIDDPTDAMALEPGGTVFAQQYRFYSHLMVHDGTLYALIDRPIGSQTQIRAIDVVTGQLNTDFDGDYGDGDGIVYEPAGISTPTGGIILDPGYNGDDWGISILAVGSGRRSLLNLDPLSYYYLGEQIYNTSSGMIVADITGACAVTDMTSWRDHVYDTNGNIYARRSNQVQSITRDGGNSASAWNHLTDAINADGTPIEGCGDGMPVQTAASPWVAFQNITYIPDTSAGTDEAILVFNDHPDSACCDVPFDGVIQIIDTEGDLPDVPVNLYDRNGTPLVDAYPGGTSIFDLHYDADNDRLLILDYLYKRILVMVPEPPCGENPYDFNGDSVVDIQDYKMFEQCLSGPGNPYPDLDHCACVDRGQDGDVDMYDFYLFQLNFGS